MNFLLKLKKFTEGVFEGLSIMLIRLLEAFYQKLLII